MVILGATCKNDFKIEKQEIGDDATIKQKNKNLYVSKTDIIACGYYTSL